MVTQYGMSDRFGMMSLESLQNQYLDGRNVFTASESSSGDVDKEVSRILNECHEKALRLLRNNKDALEGIATFLIEEETISGTQFMEMLKEKKTT
jgi:cell division protease FtsH